MTVGTALRGASVVAFAATRNAVAVRAFYEGVIGLTLREDTPFALVFDANGTTLRVQKVQELAPAAHTVFGWAVPDIRAAVQALAVQGVTFARYDGLPQDSLGIWRTPDGGAVAWFHDPDGNTLSLSQSPA